MKLMVGETEYRVHWEHTQLSQRKLRGITVCILHTGLCEPGAFGTCDVPTPRGTAYCSKADPFVKSVGRRLSFVRAMMAAKLPRETRKALGHAYEMQTRRPRQKDRVAELVSALTKAKETIRLWHGMHLATTEPEAWALYQDSPEMRQINSALQRAGRMTVCPPKPISSAPTDLPF